jgi:hypothetical protein
MIFLPMLAGVAAAVGSHMATRLVIHWARARGLYCMPGNRRMYREPVPRLGGVAILAAALLLASPAPARAQEAADSLRALYRLPVPPTAPAVVVPQRVPPASTASAPTAFGAAWGQAFVGAGFQGRARHTQVKDGAVVMGVGLGSPVRLVGAEVALTSFSTVNTGFFQRTGVSVKLHRLFPANVGVAVGWENAFTTADRNGREEAGSLYVVASQVVTVDDDPTALFATLTASLGLGTGRFRSERRILDDDGGVGVFASLGIRILEPLSVIVDWTGQDLVLAASISPFPSIPLVLTPALADVTGSAGDGTRFILSVGSGFDFARIRDVLP